MEMEDTWRDRNWHLPFEAPEEAVARSYGLVKNSVLSDDMLRRIVHDADEYVDEYEFHMRARSRRRRADGFVDVDGSERTVRSSPTSPVRIADPRRTVIARVTSLLSHLSIDAVDVSIYPCGMAREALRWGRTRWVVCSAHVNLMDDLLLIEDAHTQWRIQDVEKPADGIMQHRARVDTLTADIALNCDAPFWVALIYAIRPLTVEERGAYLDARARIADRILAMRAAEAL
jgi:hypothetical protein